MSNKQQARKNRRTQAERREESRQAVLDSACRLFGAHGYADTTLEKIAQDAGLTIRPIYHYFGNKKALFAAVNSEMEQRILDAMNIDNTGNSRGMRDNWAAFLDLCDDPAFRRIVLIDSPTILGRERWQNSAVTLKARSAVATGTAKGESRNLGAEMRNRVMMSALAEAALMIAEAPDVELAKREAGALMEQLFSRLVD